MKKYDRLVSHCLGCINDGRHLDSLKWFETCCELFVSGIQWHTMIFRIASKHPRGMHCASKSLPGCSVCAWAALLPQKIFTLLSKIFIPVYCGCLRGSTLSSELYQSHGFHFIPPRTYNGSSMWVHLTNILSLFITYGNLEFFLLVQRNVRRLPLANWLGWWWSLGSVVRFRVSKQSWECAPFGGRRYLLLSFEFYLNLTKWWSGVKTGSSSYPWRTVSCRRWAFGACIQIKMGGAVHNQYLMSPINPSGHLLFKKCTWGFLINIIL